MYRAKTIIQRPSLEKSKKKKGLKKLLEKRDSDNDLFLKGERKQGDTDILLFSLVLQSRTKHKSHTNHAHYLKVFHPKIFMNGTIVNTSNEINNLRKRSVKKNQISESENRHVTNLACLL